MGKKVTILLSALLLWLPCGCQNKTESQEGNAYPTEKQEFPIDEEVTLPTEEAPTPPPPQITKEGFWNTDEVDISQIDKNRKLIALTFDDAPARTLENILAVFASFNESNPDCIATATLFVNGKRVDKQNTHLLYAARALGFELGNHTHRHLDLTKLSKQSLEEEIAQTDALLEEIDGQALHLLRAPFGKTNDLVKETAPTPLIDWTIDTLDWTGISEEEIFHRVWTGRFSGAISLMHDGYPPSVAALKKLLPALKEDGYQVVSVSQMIKAHGCRFQKGKTYIRARRQNSVKE